MYWRRFALADMPLDDSDKFQAWMLERWREKDALLEEYVSTGRFPASEDLEIFTKDSIGSIVKTQKNGFVETEVKPAHWWEILQIFMVLASFALASHVLSRTWHFARNGTMAGYA
jgi:lysocardiolipin and lysophospholipid acyltransferase